MPQAVEMNLLKAALAALLFVIFAYQAHDQMVKFIEGQTMFSSFTESNSALELPTFTICPNPQFRGDTESIFELESSSPKWKTIKLDPNSTWDELWSKATYTAGDSITVLNSGYGSFNVNLSAHSENTLFLGSCVLVKFSGPVNAGSSVVISVKFPYKDPPSHLTVYTHPFEERFNIVLGNPSEGSPADTIPIPSMTTFLVKKLRKEKLNSNKTPCMAYNPGDSRSLCKAKRVAKTFASIPGVCAIPQAKSLLAIGGFNDTDVKPCPVNTSVYSSTQSQLIMSLSSSKFEDCLPSCKFEYYKYSTRVVRRKPISDETKLFFQYDSTEVEVQQELPIFDAISIVGSVGGLLGLYLGFSFLDFGSFAIDQILHKFKQGKKGQFVHPMI